MKAKFSVLALLSLGCSQAFGALVVDLDLGILAPGGYTLEGDISGPGTGNAEVYGTATQTYTSGEFVFAFALEQESIVSLSSDFFASGDPDSFLLNSLETDDEVSPEATGWLASAYLDGALGSTQSFGILDSGTYFLSVEDWGGGPVESFRYTLDIGDAAPEAGGESPADAIALGILGDEATVISLDTFGSATGDTELGIFDSEGNFLLANDDAPTGGLQSSLAFTALEGTYFVAAGEWNTGFSNDFGATGPSGGLITLNHNNGSSTGTISESGALWFSFGIVPEPSSMSLIALAGLTFLRRRRS